jgi:UDP-N-acetylmuramoylalanine--D-glutamate ligase
LTTALVMGMGVTGEAVARHLIDQGTQVVAVDDRPGERAGKAAEALGIELVSAPSEDELAALVAAADMVVVSPGVPHRHPLYALAAHHEVPVVSEIELASRAATMPLVAVTGTNGKTTVTTLIAAMLAESGVRAMAAGNIGLPLIDAVAQVADVVVAEVSSFQLEYIDTFRPDVAVWLNLAEDHLDWHPTMDHYAAAKARIWANQQSGDTAVVNADDAAVMALAASAPSRVQTFGLAQAADWGVVDGVLRGPGGVELVAVTDLPRALPHDIANSLAAAAAALAAGATVDACRSVLADFAGLPHRVELVRDAGGVRWYDDSKATTPASVVAAVRGFDSVVLIAGGRNKGLDLGALREVAERVRFVVAIGDAAGEVQAAFAGVRPVAVATSMDHAVVLAAAGAQSGDAVLLSPGCASFDWYGSYAERGDDFVRAVKEHVGP